MPAGSVPMVDRPWSECATAGSLSTAPIRQLPPPEDSLQDREIDEDRRCALLSRIALLVHPDQRAPPVLRLRAALAAPGRHKGNFQYRMPGQERELHTAFR